jgi:hypothetical protein
MRTHRKDISKLVDPYYKPIVWPGPLRPIHHHLCDARRLICGTGLVAYERGASEGLHDAWVGDAVVAGGHKDAVV